MRRRDPKPPERPQPFSDDLLGRIGQLLDEVASVEEPWEQSDSDPW